MAKEKKIQCSKCGNDVVHYLIDKQDNICADCYIKNQLEDEARKNLPRWEDKRNAKQE